MTLRVGINGFGRIGRGVVRALYENNYRDRLQVVAVNGSASAETYAHLTKHDTVHGRFAGEVSTQGETIIINGDRIDVLDERDPAKLGWGDLGVDLVMECTGKFRGLDKARPHLQAGAAKVVVSAPAGEDMPTIVFGVNDDTLTADDDIISCASCTTNGLVPLVAPLHATLGVESGLMTTIHAYTNDQMLTDVHHKDLRRARSATQNMIPTKTGAAAAVGLVLPELAGKLDGFSIRVPTINVSLVDLTFTAGRATSVEEVNDILRSAAQSKLKGVLAYNDEPLVSSDFNHTSVSSTVESSLTRVTQGTLVKACAWYDNEWGFANRMIDTSLALANA